MRTLMIIVGLLTLAVPAMAQQSYILTNYDTARLAWEYGPIGANNAPERAVIQCQVGLEGFESSVPYPTTEIRVVEVVPQPRSAEYRCVVLAENRAGRSAPSQAVTFSVLRIPEPPGNLRLLP
jgi:hypothetical protein